MNPRKKRLKGDIRNAAIAEAITQLELAIDAKIKAAIDALVESISLNGFLEHQARNCGGSYIDLKVDLSVGGRDLNISTYCDLPNPGESDEFY